MVENQSGEEISVSSTHSDVVLGTDVTHTASVASGKAIFLFKDEVYLRSVDNRVSLTAIGRLTGNRWASGSDADFRLDSASQWRIVIQGK